MATTDEDDVPDTGAIFTFGKSRFADNIPGKFWIRDDPVLQVACGDEHTALVTASGRVFTFGSNEWGQLGHGHTKLLHKPTCVKGLKQERVILAACGKSHTLIATDGGVYGFGANGERQLGITSDQPSFLEPVHVKELDGIDIKMICAGAEHSMALTDRGAVLVWGSGDEGQLGLTDITDNASPTELKLEASVICISAGYYHSALVTEDGKLYTFGEGVGGKLGLPETLLKKNTRPQSVSGIQGKVVWVSCGGNHTLALTADGRPYSFGDGNNGQLGLGTKVLDAPTPQPVRGLEGLKIARASSGENHTAFLTETGQFYVCGDGRHGKLGLVEGDSEALSNQFFPTLVTRFFGFQVQQVACGGCHTVVLAVRQAGVSLNEEDIVNLKANDLNTPSAAGRSARDRRRQKTGQLPPLSQENISKKRPSLDDVIHNPLNKSKLPGIGAEKDLTKAEDDEAMDRPIRPRRQSLFQQATDDDTIRHADSDVESEVSEVSDLNKTHVLTVGESTPDQFQPLKPRPGHSAARFSDIEDQNNEDSEQELSTEEKEVVPQTNQKVSVITEVKKPYSQEKIDTSDGDNSAKQSDSACDRTATDDNKELKSPTKSSEKGTSKFARLFGLHRKKNGLSKEKSSDEGFLTEESLKDNKNKVYSTEQDQKDANTSGDQNSEKSAQKDHSPESNAHKSKTCNIL
ncbi:X-linked retinitis pigmentosa GTPase regulator-like [Limulus polyphemus]|uniref:X-linked retinitis pigmentosa GTPase regulator-like n=1 Tax=Limulus polyphemus TaxID=6850 RepID=A0ABM1SLT9_LIMPO|nr:X-linked retinitis pigmentosa GTPase regulator-like [Limulus polyphemus]